MLSQEFLAILVVFFFIVLLTSTLWMFMPKQFSERYDDHIYIQEVLSLLGYYGYGTLFVQLPRPTNISVEEEQMEFIRWHTAIRFPFFATPFSDYCYNITFDVYPTSVEVGC